MTAAETIAHGVKVFAQEIADLRHSLHIRKAQVAEKDQRIAELEAALDDLLMHCVDGPSADWVMLPRTEFDQVKGRLQPKPKQE